MGVSETACGRGGSLDPSPYPLPWVWTGGGASGQSVQDGPRWLQEGLREPKMASKMAQYTSRRLKIAFDMHPRGSKTAPRRFQVPSEPSEDHPKRPNGSQT